MYSFKNRITLKIIILKKPFVIFNTLLPVSSMGEGGQLPQLTSRDFPNPLDPYEVVTATLDVPYSGWDHQMAQIKWSYHPCMVVGGGFDHEGVLFLCYFYE